MNHHATRHRTITIAMLAAASTTTLAFAAARGGDPVGGGDDVVDVPDYQTTWRSFTSSDTPDFYVSDPSESIQDAIDDAQDWDIIELGDGEWIETLDFQGKAIWLITFDNAQLRGVNPHTGSLLNHTLGRFQQAGSAADYAHLRLSNLEFIGEDETQCLQAINTTVEIIGCSFKSWNSTYLVQSSIGAAIRVIGCNLTVRDCTFEHCQSKFGGAISVYGGHFALSDSTFENCTALKGGAVRANDCWVDLCHNITFRSCKARLEIFYPPENALGSYFGYGSALHFSVNAPITVSACHFENNDASMAAAIYSSGTHDIDVIDCSFDNNKGYWFSLIDCHRLQMHRCVLNGNVTETEHWIIQTNWRSVDSTISHSRFCGNSIGNLTTFVTDATGTTQTVGHAIDVSTSWMRPNLTCNPCESDLDIDGTVGITELLFLLNDWGKVSVLQDADGDRFISASDLVSLLADWGPCEEDSFAGE